MKEKISVLLVDDEPLPRSRLRRAFDAAMLDDFDFDVEEACSVAEYQQRVRCRHFDVLIIDLRLNVPGDGTDDVVRFHRIHSPDTIIVAYSGFPGGEVVRSAVDVMRAGAVDCIEKSSKDSTKRVVERVVDELRHRRSPESGPTSEWLERVLPDLVREYGGMAIAIVGQEVVCSEANIPALRREITKLALSHAPYLMVVPNWKDEECL